MQEQIYWAKVCRRGVYKYGGDLYNIWIEYQKEQLQKEVKDVESLLLACEKEMKLLEEEIVQIDHKKAYYSKKLIKACSGTLTWELCHYELNLIKRIPKDLKSLEHQKRLLTRQLNRIRNEVNDKMSKLTVTAAEMYFDNLFSDGGYNKMIWAGLEYLVS